MTTSCGRSTVRRKRSRCRDVRFYVNRLVFEQLGAERAAVLNAVPSRFRLAPEQVDTLIEAGAEALRINPAFRDFLSSVGGTPRPVRRHVPPFKRAPAARIAEAAAR